MSSITNINNNSSIVNVGRTTPVDPGQAPASRSIPVVLASDQAAIPVEEQNKIQSEVALSLLGIPRSEVALGIFADVNTYDVNTSEWSFSPTNHQTGFGIRHLPNEAGALIESPKNKIAILTSKRFFRYQPGRVSAATFGVKSTVSTPGYGFSQNPVIRKCGIFDNFDGYYWETRQTGKGDNFAVVRRTQSLLPSPISPFGNSGDSVRGITPASTLPITQNDDYRFTGIAPDSTLTSPDLLSTDRQLILEAKFDVIETVSNNQTDAFYANLASDVNVAAGTSFTAEDMRERCRRDIDIWIDNILEDMEWGANSHVTINLTNFGTAVLPDANTYEVAIYNDFKTELSGVAGLTGTAVTKIQTLSDIIIAAFGQTNPPTPSSGDISAIDYGSKPKLETIFDVKKNYWAYLASVYDIDGNTITYAAGGESEEVIRNKCLRDTTYLIDGYKNDIVGGGNAETKYNASMYFLKEGLAVSSQIAEPDNEPVRQAYVRNLILGDLMGDISPLGYANTFGVFTTGFGYANTSSEVEDVDTLTNLIIDNFTSEDTSSVVRGARGFAGNLVVYRDGLLHVHAGVYDPSMLKDAENIPANLRNVTPNGNNMVTLAKGNVTFGHHVKYVGNTNGDLTGNTIYKVSNVIGTRGNEFQLQTEAGANVDFSDGSGFFQTVVPFIFPDTYDPDVWRGASDVPFVTNNTFANTGANDGRLPEGMMFPYEYSSSGNLTDTPVANSIVFVGYINTTESNVINVRSDVDDVNFIPEYINWVKNNVKPEFYNVYEYRVPRSRYSFDRLDGQNSSANSSVTKVLYSDRATKADGSIAYPGEIYVENDAAVDANSVFNYDFTKVTMLKIEFSWYGAVGALFLAYVPIENGDARWVRVHHLRASNQLKISSLGNATLPITYNVYGGGDANTLGGDDTGVLKGYGSESHHIVKYGSSYYIDGGDRGTVRLYSHNNPQLGDALGKQWTANTNNALWNAANNELQLDITAGANTSVDPTFFMGAKINTGSRIDSNIEVVWANTTHIFLSSTPSGWGTNPTVSDIKLLPDRANSVYGLETKENITSAISGTNVRNRVQVYPTRLSSSNLGNNPIRLRLRKSPIFQYNVTTSGTITLNDTYQITSNNVALSVTESAAPYIANGESIYGWFKARVDVADSGNVITVFGRLYKEADLYYFELSETINGIVFLLSTDSFLKDQRFDYTGNILTGTTKTTSEKEGISSILVVDDDQVPIPQTGINIATIYLQQGTEQLDLASYFDYNKEYLSYPLTNIPDTLYFAVDSDTSSGDAADNVSVGVTWEEQ